MNENRKTGRVCYGCGQPEWSDDEPFGTAQPDPHGTIYIWCGGCPA